MFPLFRHTFIDDADNVCRRNMDTLNILTISGSTLYVGMAHPAPSTNTNF